MTTFRQNMRRMARNYTAPTETFLARNSWLVAGITLAIMLAVFVVPTIFPSLATDGFTGFGLASAANLIDHSVVWGIAVVGIVMLMISGEFDLSVGSNMAAGGFIFVALLNFGLLAPLILLSPLLSLVGVSTDFYLSGPVVPPFAAAILAVLFSATLGFINGAIVTFTHNPSFIITLGTQYAYRGIPIAISIALYDNAQAVYPALGEADIAPSWFIRAIKGPLFSVGGFSLDASVLWLIGIVAIGIFIMYKTKLGSWIYATGGNEGAAKAAGIPTRRLKILMFSIVGALAGIAGIISITTIIGQPAGSEIAETVNVALPKSHAIRWELFFVIAAVIGGARLAGGFGTVAGAIIGVVAIKLIENVPIVFSVDTTIFFLILGALLIAVAAINQYLGKANE